jgi:hypothetical protein
VHNKKIKPQVLQCSRKTFPKNSSTVEYNLYTHTQLPNFEIGGRCMYSIYDIHTYMSYYIKLVLPPPQTGAVLIPMIGIDLRGWLFTRGPSGGFHNVDTNPSILMKEVTIRTVCKRLSLIIFGYFSFSKCLLDPGCSFLPLPLKNPAQSTKEYSMLIGST